jgi:hypothetical protein
VVVACFSSLNNQYTEDGVRRAVTKSQLLFDADYSNLKAQDVLLAFENDPRMVQIPMEEALEVPIIKLSAKYGLVATNGSFKYSVLVSHYLTAFQARLKILSHRKDCI